MTRLQGFIAFLSAVVGVVAAVQALSSKTGADEAAREAGQFKRELEQRASERADHEVSAKYDAVAYEAVVKVLEIDRAKVDAQVAEKRERAVMALIVATASPSMKVALFDVVGSGSNVSPAVKADANKAADFLRDVGSLASDAAPAAQAPPAQPTKPAVTAAATSSLKGYRVVVFFCQGTVPAVASSQRQAADRLVQEMQASPAVGSLQMQWEVKELPEVLNSSPGYNIRTNQVRYNPTEGEETPSLALVSVLEASSTLKALNVRLERQVVRKLTPSYLSVFLCGLP